MGSDHTGMPVADFSGREQPNDDASARRTYLSDLFRFTDRLYRARSLDQAYGAALDAIGDMLGCSRASILRFDDDGRLRFAAWRGLSEQYRAGAEGHSPWKRGEEDPQPIYLADISQADLPPGLAATVLSERIHAMAFIPLMAKAGVAGEVVLYYHDTHVFSAEEREATLAIARQLGFAIERSQVEQTLHRLAAVVESSDDAIISKTLDGIITSWNSGAERLFGYDASEAVGRSVLMLIPPDRHNEEPTILSRIRAGERIEHYETVRRRKDGSLVDISLSVSPVRDASGVIVGASKIARDITERRRTQEQQQLLLHEMNHRVKNLFALASSIVNLSANSADTPAALASIVSERLGALSRAHALTMAPGSLDTGFRKTTTLHALIGAILAPYTEGSGVAGQRFSIVGDDLELADRAVTPVALLLHEFATNAAKYGSFSVAKGRVEIECRFRGEDIVLLWRELGGPAVRASDVEGFGSRLIKLAASQFGHFSRDWHPDGLVIELTLDRRRVGT